MMNQVIIVGRIATEFKTVKASGKEGTLIKIAVPRSYKEENGEYVTDILPVFLTGSVATNTAEYCKQGDIVGVKGTLVLDIYQGKKALYIRGEKITFLSSKSREKDDEDE